LKWKLPVPGVVGLSFGLPLGPAEKGKSFGGIFKYAESIDHNPAWDTMYRLRSLSNLKARSPVLFADGNQLYRVFKPKTFLVQVDRPDMNVLCQHL
jgi:hypothetical protein